MNPKRLKKYEEIWENIEAGIESEKGKRIRWGDDLI